MLSGTEFQPTPSLKISLTVSASNFSLFSAVSISFEGRIEQLCTRGSATYSAKITVACLNCSPSRVRRPSTCNGNTRSGRRNL